MDIPNTGGRVGVTGISTATVITPSPARVAVVSVTVSGASAGGIYDSASTVAASGANVGSQILTIPSGQAAGTVYTMNWPCSVGITVVPGTSGVISLSYV